MKKTLITALAIALSALTSFAEPKDYSPHVVELAATRQNFDPRNPWAKTNPSTTKGFGVIVPGPYILTTAKNIRNATLVKAGKYGGPPTAAAHVFHRDEEINLAVVAVDDAQFYNDLETAPLAPSLPSGKSVYSVRWNNGQLESSAIRISRIQVQAGPLSDLELAFLLATTDISGGGFAEPAFAENELIGITVFQDRNGQTRILPVEIISSYLEALNSEEEYKGFASLGVGWQPNRDQALAEYLGMKGQSRGVIISGTAWGATARGKIIPGDFLLSLDNCEIDSEGYYKHAKYGKLNFMNILTDGRRAGDFVEARLLRNGAEITETLELKRYPASARLISWRESDDPPPYFIGGGFVFIELDVNYLSTWGKAWRDKANIRLLTYMELEKEAQGPDREKIIILADVLPDAYNIGWQNMKNLAVQSINGRRTDSIADIAEAFKHPEGEFHVVDFFPNRVAGKAVLDAAAYETASKRILKKYSITSQMR